jgi:two-component system, NtrC family, sensor histidine kinase HydH
MMKKMIQRDKKFWVGFSPWIIIGAVVILVPIFIAITMMEINKQNEHITQFLVERGAAMIRSFEAGARTGIGMQWSGFQLQKLLIETAQQPFVDHLILVNSDGTIMADSDPSMVGETYGKDLDLILISGSKQLYYRQVPNADGADTFEVCRQFAPTEESFQGFRTDGKSSGGSSGFIIFVGLDMRPVIAARERETRHTVWMAIIFFLIGCSGVISLFLAQNYRLAKTSLSRMKAFSDSLVENMPMGLIALNSREEIVTFNQTAESITGRLFREVIGKKADDVIPAPCLALLENLKKEKRVIEKDIDCPVRNGEIVPLEVIATRAEDKGVFLGYVILIRDITEIQNLKKEIVRSQRLASLGNLAAGVAHEIRNPLSSIKGFATFFKERYRDNPEDEKTAEIMIQEVDRLNRVISQLLEFARPMDLEKQPVSIQKLIGYTMKMIERQAEKKEIIIHSELSPNVGDILIDSDKITQVFLNLSLNAIEAMERGGVLSVNLFPQHEGRIRIDIADTGRGMDQEELAYIFDPYFTTKPAGTGLGLAIVHKIIEAHKGEIRAASVKGKGTTVSVFLPAD